MIDGVDLTEGLYCALEEAAAAQRQMAGLARKKHEAERRYRIARASRTLYERAENRIPATLIPDIVRGQEDIALIAFERDCAGSDYDANYEALLLAKKRIDTYREMMDREWAQSR